MSLLLCRPPIGIGYTTAGDGGGGGGGPDFTQFPAASGQDRNNTAYDALNVPSLSAGSFFTLPGLSIQHLKITDSSSGQSNRGAFHTYSEGQVEVSCRWGTTKHTIHVIVIQTASPYSGHDYFADVDVVSGAVSNYRACPAAVAGQWTFSQDPTLPRIMFYVNGSGVIQRYDTSTSSAANIGNFPHTPTGGVSATGWFQGDRTNRWFGWQNSGSVCLWDSQTSTEYTRAASGLDEFYLSRDGGKALINASTPGVWDPVAGTFTALTSLGNYGMGHNPRMRDYWAIFDPSGNVLNTTPAARFNATAPNTRTQFSTMNGYTPDGHAVGLANGAADTTQGFIRCQFSQSGSFLTGTGAPDALAYFTIDGSEFRMLGHHYNTFGGGTPTGLPDYYYRSQGHPNVSGDGLFIIYDSNMNNSGRLDIMGIVVPTAA